MAQRRSPLREAHDDLGARFTTFGGWEMPVRYDSIAEEHTAVREAVGRFDVSHMGQVTVGGPDATALMQRLTTNDVEALDPGDAQYAAITDGEGVMLDDTLVYRLPVDTTLTAGAPYLFVPNAGHDAEMADRWRVHRDEWGLDATVENQTTDRGMIAVQGPEAISLVADLAGDTDAVGALSRFQAAATTVAGVESLVARTGYTGEDGVEIVCPRAGAETVWNALECRPCGLGSRDTLRMEMGYLLSGQDFDPDEEPRTPYEAGIGFTVALDTDFVGRDALADQAETGVDETFVGVVLEERGVPRHGYALTDADGRTVGRLTSGTVSPTLDDPIGLGYLPVDLAEPGTEVQVVIRDARRRARVSSLPFIDQ